MKFRGQILSKIALLAAAAALSIAPNSASFAQENVTIDGVEATRIVIGPPQSELALNIKQGLQAKYTSAQRSARAFEEAQKLYFFYGGRKFEPLWITQEENGDLAFSEHAQKIISMFEKAEYEGLNPSDYLTDDLSLEQDFSDPTKIAALETSFSESAVRFAQHMHGGRIRPRDVSRAIDLSPSRIDGASFLIELAASDAPDQMLMDLAPKHAEYHNLRALLARNIDGLIEEIIPVPDGQILKPDMDDPRVPQLREKLGLDAIADNIIYDELLVAAVESFQQSNGLVVDGVIGPATLAAINGGSNVSEADIIANMERWRWVPREFGDFHVFVNIPEYRLFVNKGEEQQYTTRVIVGKRKHQTPVFSDEIEHVVMNPYWNVPRSIAKNEIGPIVASNPGYLAAKNMELLAGGKAINAANVDWSTANINNYRIRQRPGAGNALGNVKFLFPNSHSVYLHDTPSRSLFSRSTRAFSHGCVRVHNPMDFAEALLAQEPNLSRAGLEAQRGPRERWNNLDTHVPVHIAYFTVRVDEDGNARNFADIYGQNTKLKSLMGLEG